MELLLSEKKLEYLDYILQKLEDNKERISLEQETAVKMHKSFKELLPKFNEALKK